MTTEQRSEEVAFLTVVGAFVDMIPVYLLMCAMLSLTIMYSYAIVGMELFTSKDSTCDIAAYMQYDHVARFCDLSTSYMALFQVRDGLLTNNPAISSITMIISSLYGISVPSQL